MKLLLADDDEDQLALRSLNLERAGYQVCTASDEATALQTAAEQKPQVAIVDLRMPTEEAGLRVLRALKAQDAALRLIVLTGHNSRHLDKLPERALVELVLAKGSSSRQLIRHLQRGPTSP